MRAYQIDIEKPGVRVSHLTAGFFIALLMSRTMDEELAVVSSRVSPIRPKSQTARFAMKRLMRFRLRTMFALLAIVAASLVFIPKLWHRYRVNRAIANTIEGGPDISWQFAPFASITRDNLFLLLSDLDRVLGRLYEVVTDETEPPERQQHAAATMEALLARSGTAPLRAKWLRKLINLISNKHSATGAKEAILEVIADWIPASGLTRDERSKLFAVAQRESLTPGWTEVLIASGGREETLFVLQHGGTHDQQLSWAIHNSSLIRQRWPGLLGYVKNWLDDPVVAKDRVLDYAILTSTPIGRRVLLEYALNTDRPMVLRKQALSRLQENFAGVDLIADATKDEDVAANLEQVAGGKVNAVLAAARAKIDQDSVNNFWQRLVDGVTPNYWFSNSTKVAGLPEVETQLEQTKRELARTYTIALQKLTGHNELSTPEEWQSWLRQTRPKPLSQAELLQAIIDNPDLLSVPDVIRLMVPWHLGEIPPDCMPLYKKLLHEGTPYEKYWAWQALLQYSDDLEAVPIAIELISFSKPSDTSSVHPGEVTLLQERFGENFFWDIDAWKSWWQEYQIEAAEEERAIR